ncbi:MAG: hypothetical protein HZB13_19130, partial [Acidobacteria bacterium]|nr:hypothetical protein [Acidobacteriota bacterium]
VSARDGGWMLLPGAAALVPDNQANEASELARGLALRTEVAGALDKLGAIHVDSWCESCALTKIPKRLTAGTR